MAKAFQTNAGYPSPLGSSLRDDGVNFALFSAHATAVTLCLFSADGQTETDHIALAHRTGDIWHTHVTGVKAGQLYGYRVDGPYAPHEGHRFNVHKLLIDPYAKQLLGDFILDDALYGFDKHAPDKDLSFNTQDSAPFVPKCVVGEITDIAGAFDWEGVTPPKTPLADTIIYECHIKGLTKQHPDIAKPKQGTVQGLADPAMIAHLTALGVTAVEILPLQSFFSEPRLLEMGLTNYWGYNPVNYFAPHAAYLGADLGPSKSQAIQAMVKALHAAGIEVILDVVYNHTAESWELGPTLSYRGLDNKSYYHLKDDARFYENYTGCGNSLNMTHPAVLELTLASLRHWVDVYHFDGFRFDLGPTLGRNPVDYDRNAAFFNAVKSDPVLSGVKLISEPWDIVSDGYQLGGFPKGWQEWNDQFRDAVRSFWRGDGGAHQDLAGRLLGSAQHFDHSGRDTFSSVNFVSAHDGFTLHDTVSYNAKHNLANGEDNRDGHSHNLSDNMGIEGPTNDADIMAARRVRKINMLATLILSQGIPMLLAGDEFGQSQRGNNNAYCQDNDITWLDWSDPDEALLAATKDLIALRKRYPHFRQHRFLHGQSQDGTHAPDVVWLSETGCTLMPSQWEQAHRGVLAMMLSLEGQGSVLVILNRGDSADFHLPLDADWHVAFSSTPIQITQDQIALLAQSVCVLHSQTIALAREQREALINQAAEQAGILSDFRDISGHIHVTPLETKAAILKSMGRSYTAVQTNLKAPIMTEPQPVFGAQYLGDNGKIWGVTAALYGLRSDRNWGVGDFEDLAQFCEIMAGQGADFIGINPVHALFPSASHLFAPYSPSSRHALNVMHIAPDKVPEITAADVKALQPELIAARADDFVDYDTVHNLKQNIFELAFSRFQALSDRSHRKKEFKRFTEQAGESARAQAVFDAIFETLPDTKKSYAGYAVFPDSLRDYANPAVTEFAQTHCDRVDFYLYLQWIAQAQLKAAQNRALAAGMSVGLYLDFAVGVVPGGADAWRHKPAFAKDISLGAPGDAANPDGQMWNLLPFDPHRLAENNFEPYRNALRNMMSYAGAVRIDHILGHMRSFWTPMNADGTPTQGAYVRYPLDGLLQMIAEESHAAKCIVIGEDLGTVPDGLRHEMYKRQLMGCGIVIIERDSHGQVLPVSGARELSLTAYSNHDFPTLAGFWNGVDFEWREALGISSDANLLIYERARRERDKAALAEQAGLEPDTPAPLTPKSAAALHRALASSPALAVAVQLEDLLLQRAQPNVPGTTDEQPNWRRKYNVSLKALSKADSFLRITRAMRDARPKPSK